MLNELKSIYVNFVNIILIKPPTLNISAGLWTVVPYRNNAKYLGMALDAKLQWKEQVDKKRAEHGLKYR